MSVFTPTEQVKQNMEAIIAQTMRLWSIPNFSEPLMNTEDLKVLLRPYQNLAAYKNPIAFWSEVWAARVQVSTTIAMRVAKAYGMR